MVMKALSSLYKIIVQGREKLYSSKVKSSSKLATPVIVIGNITAGGTGKTPFVDYTLNFFKKSKLAAGVISRGYGGNYSGVISVDLNSEEATRIYGDEPTLLKLKHPDTPIYLSASRYLAGKELLDANKQIKAIICDDGFQHFSLQRDLNVVLIDCTERLQNYKMLPNGRLREPLEGLARANFIIFTKYNWATKEQTENMKTLVGKYYNLNENNHALANYNSVFPKLESNKVLLVSSIAKPDYFEKNVSESGLYNIKGHLTFKDHHNFSEKDISDIIQEFNYSKCDWILTTEKDMVKLDQFDKIRSKIKTVGIEVELTSGKESFERELFKNFN